MLSLTVYPKNFGEPSASPFCVKAMCLLEMAGASWTPEFSTDPRKAPKAKFPVLQTEARPIADSDQIREYLEDSLGADFDQGLTPEQKATSRAVIRMAEEHLYFALVCDRWLDEANWAHVREVLFGNIPFFIRGIVTRKVRKQAFAYVHGQGMGRHTAEERFRRARKDIRSIRDLLGDKPFLFGDHPTAADATVVPLLRGIAAAPEPTELSTLVNSDSALTAYLERGRKAMYPR